MKPKKNKAQLNLLFDCWRGFSQCSAELTRYTFYRKRHSWSEPDKSALNIERYPLTHDKQMRQRFTVSLSLSGFLFLFTRWVLARSNRFHNSRTQMALRLVFLAVTFDSKCSKVILLPPKHLQRTERAVFFAINSSPTAQPPINSPKEQVVTTFRTFSAENEFNTPVKLRRYMKYPWGKQTNQFNSSLQI